MENTHYGNEYLKERIKAGSGIWFLGIGGAGMSGMARVCNFRGYRVGGTDRIASEKTRSLENCGSPVKIGEKTIPKGYPTVVYTVAIGEKDPAYADAKKKGLLTVSRSDFLGFLTSGTPVRIGIAGIHGKSTVTAMLGTLLSDKDPTVLCGADVKGWKTENCLLGSGEETVFESCEYRDSFLDLDPNIALIHGIGLDHVDYFQNMAQIRRSFLSFAEKAGENGLLVANVGDGEVRNLLKKHRGKTVTYGVGCKADFTAKRITRKRGVCSFDFCLCDSPLCRVRLRIPGTYQAQNALAAATVAFLCGRTPEQIGKSLSRFQGVKRRLEYHGICGGADLYEDYAHHPDAIRSTLETAKEMGYEEILCVFQPHTYSRTAGLLEEFSTAFENADRVILPPIYAARETNESGITSKILAEKIGEKAETATDFEDLRRKILRYAKPKTLILIMGAGDVNRVIPMLNPTD